MQKLYLWKPDFSSRKITVRRVHKISQWEPGGDEDGSSAGSLSRRDSCPDGLDRSLTNPLPKAEDPLEKNEKTEVMNTEIFCADNCFDTQMRTFLIEENNSNFRIFPRSRD